MLMYQLLHYCLVDNFHDGLLVYILTCLFYSYCVGIHSLLPAEQKGNSKFVYLDKRLILQSQVVAMWQNIRGKQS